MTFVHDDTDFDALLAIVAQKRSLSRGLVEKDYWITHSLWALHQVGFEAWFKGGTSLSKGFGLIERFSEDLDLKIEPGRVGAVPHVTSWKSEGKKAIREREAFFAALADTIKVQGATVALDPTFKDPTHRNAHFRVDYPGQHRDELAGVLKPFVVLEVGSARVTPFVDKDLSSFIHDHLAEIQQLDGFDDNRPRQVHCVHPLVSLVEKLDALHKRVNRTDVEPATFVRHFEDAARVIRAEPSLPPLQGYAGPLALAKDMLAHKQIVALPSPDDPAFTLQAGERTDAVRRAYAAIASIFWGPRLELDESCTIIRQWIERTFADATP